MFWYDVLPFSFVSRCFWMPLLISSWTHWWFRAMLLTFHFCVKVSIFFLLLFSGFLTLLSERTLDTTSILLSSGFVLWPNKWSVLKTAPCRLRRMCVWCPVHQTLKYSSNPMSPHWFSVWAICLLMKGGTEVPYCYCVYYYFRICWYLLCLGALMLGG